MPFRYTLAKLLLAAALAISLGACKKAPLNREALGGLSGEEGFARIEAIMDEYPGDAEVNYRGVEILSQLLALPATRCKYYPRIDDSFRWLHRAVRANPDYAAHALTNPALEAIRPYLPFHYALNSRPQNYLQIKSILIEVAWREAPNPESPGSEGWSPRFGIDFTHPNGFLFGSSDGTSQRAGELVFDSAGITLRFLEGGEGFWARLEGERLIVRNSLHDLVFVGGPTQACSH